MSKFTRHLTHHLHWYLIGVLILIVTIAASRGMVPTSRTSLTGSFGNLTASQFDVFVTNARTGHSEQFKAGDTLIATWADQGIPTSLQSRNTNILYLRNEETGKLSGVGATPASSYNYEIPANLEGVFRLGVQTTVYAYNAFSEPFTIGEQERAMGDMIFKMTPTAGASMRGGFLQIKDLDTGENVMEVKNYSGGGLNNPVPVGRYRMLIRDIPNSNSSFQGFLRNERGLTNLRQIKAGEIEFEFEIKEGKVTEVFMFYSL